jgi:predicted nucleic acid-binding protein
VRTPKLYLETSVFNFVFAGDAPDKKADTLKLFEEINAGKYVPYTSDYVTDELEKDTSPKRLLMLDLIAKYNISVLSASDEVKRLAAMYVEAGIIPGKYATDAQHIAVATANNLDIITSWNFKHIVKLKTIVQTEVINMREGYRRMLICSPTEVIENVE